MIIFIYGKDRFRSRQKLNELRLKFVKDVDVSGDSVSFVDGEKATMADISQATGAGSLFASKRMIIIENISLNKDKSLAIDLKKFLEKNDTSENITVFLDSSDGKGLARNVLWKYLLGLKFVQNFEILNATNLATWIKTEAGNLGGIITHAQAMRISAMLGSDLYKAHNELNKLINFKKGKLSSSENVAIDDEDITTMLKGKVDENIFALTDAISGKRKGEALKLLEDELGIGTAPTYLMHMIIRQFRILMQVRQALDMGENPKQIATTLKLHPFVVSKSLNQARSYSFQVLKDIFLKLIDLDRDLKTGNAEFNVSIGLMISKL